MFDFDTLILEEKNIGKNPYYLYKVEELEAINNQLIAIKKTTTLEKTRQDAISLLIEHTDSIPLNFVAGRINLLLNPHEAQIRLSNLMNSFHEKRNFSCAKFVALKILEASESSGPLRVLGEIAETEGDEKAKWDYFERYVKCDSEDTEIIVDLADYYEEKGDKKNAKSYYQRALNRLLSSLDQYRIKKVFKALLLNGESDFSFYSQFLNKVEDQELSLELHELLLKDLSSHLGQFLNTATPLAIRKFEDNIILTSRKILLMDKDNEETSLELKNVLELRYSSLSRYNELIKKYDKEKSNNPVKALDDFLRNIVYSKNSYVIQNATKKVGLIVDVNNKGIICVKFSSRPGDEVNISIDNAVSSLSVLSNQDIRAIKKGKKTEVIRAKILGEGGTEWILKTMLLSSPGHSAQLKDMKFELVPSILNEKEWDKVSKDIKEEALVNSYIDVLDKGVYHLREFPSSFEERVYETFKTLKKFSEKASLLLDSVVRDDFDITSDAFLSMARYFSEITTNEECGVSMRIESVLIIEYLASLGASIVSEVSFEDLYCSLELSEKKKIYDDLSNKDSRKNYIKLVLTYDKDAYPTLEDIFIHNPSKELMNNLQELNIKKFNDLYASSVRNYKENIELFAFFADLGFSKNDLKLIKITRAELTELELNALNNVSNNDKLVKKIKKDLVSSKSLDQYIKESTLDSVKKISFHFIWNDGFTSDEKEYFKSKILSLYPDFTFGLKEKQESKNNEEVSVVRGFMCTRQSFNKKQKELLDIKENQIPQTLHEIKTARDLGDLRENSEYQYAKDHKAFLDRMLESLSMDLSQVKIMSIDEVLDGRVGFGTHVTLFDKKDNKNTEYTFLGRWESDPDNAVIDINAPLGNALINKKVGDEVSFKLGDQDFDYRIDKIEKIDF